MTCYRLVVNNDLVSVVQDYDYSDLDFSNVLRNPDDKSYYLRFDDEDEAVQYLNERIKPENIHPDWKRDEFHQDHLFK